jgi:cobalt-precorrin 5A hydrolase
VVKELAIVALTPNGQELGRRIVQALGKGEVSLAQHGVRQTLTELFEAGRPLVCIMALGIVVRILGPLAKDKQTDPAVVVVDEAGRFAVSVLGGHGAGANELANDVAQAIGAAPVITTASEAMGLPPLDLLGQHWGWRIESEADLTGLAAASIRGEPIAVFQNAGYPYWWQAFGEWPAHYQWVKEWPAGGEWSGVLAVTDQVWPKPRCPSVIYRPPTLVLGVGCRRGVTCNEIEEMFQQVWRDHRLAPLSLARIATVTLKKDERGLLEFAAGHKLGLEAYSVEQLASVPNLPTPSTKVQELIGAAGVAEPAALLAAGADQLLVPKQRNPRITMAVARSRLQNPLRKLETAK